MKITSVKIKNFRGFRNEKEIRFDNVPFVLLSAPNGSGKTSVIDAIEWCLTGSIGRLKAAYDKRSTNNNERKVNWDGILKNKDADVNDFVEVTLTYEDGDREYTFVRKQKADNLDSGQSVVELVGSEEDPQSELDKIIDKSFYNYHFCDVQKSFSIQSTQRKDLPSLFTEFISDYSNEETIAKNLDLFANDVNHKENDVMRKRDDVNIKIENINKRINSYAGEPEIVQYPSEFLFEDEVTDISKFDMNQLIRQKEQLYTCGYSMVVSYLDQLESDRIYQDLISKLRELSEIYIQNQDDIAVAVKKKLYKNSAEKYEEIDNAINKYKNIILSSNNIREHSELLLGFDSQIFTREYYDKTIKDINDNEKKLQLLEKEIKHMTEGNVILSAFTEMLSQRKGILKYREESGKCPVCGSPKFGELSEKQVMSEAEKYINDNNSLVCKKNEERDKMQVIIKDLYKSMLERANSVITSEIEKITVERREIGRLLSTTNQYFTMVERINKVGIFKLDVEEEQIVDIKRKIESCENKLLEESKKQQFINNYQQILRIMGYKYDGEDESTLLLKAKDYAKECPRSIIFNYDLFVRKINSINSYMNSNDYMTQVKDLHSQNKLKKELEEEIDKFELLRKKAETQAEKIRDIVNALKQEEYESVGPVLSKYYKKLARIDALSAVNIVPGDEQQLSIVDDNGKYLVNILSNGQLGVFMLAYFFASITKRGDREKFKVFFIDDLTACMDDVNMLSFLDVIKYQMLDRSDNKNIDQIFFLTCDDRISKLLKYKLHGCAVEFSEINEFKLQSNN